RNHPDGGALACLGGNLRRESGREQALDEIVRQRGGRLTNGWDTDLLDVFEAAKLRVHSREGRCAKLEAPRVVVKRQVARIKGELLALAEPSGNCRLEAPRHRFAHIEEHNAGTTE